jgi:ArsR family transcriptional regulator
MTIRLDGLLKAVGEPTRLRLLNLLREGSICVCDLQAILEIPQPTISRHLAALRHGGLVQDVRNGTRVVYSLTAASTPQLKALYELLDKCCPCDEVMQSDLARLKEALRLGKCRVEPYNSSTSDRTALATRNKSSARPSK